MRIDAWAGTLSWCNSQVWFSHNSGLFLRTTFLKHAKTSWYNCLFTTLPRSTNSQWTMPFQSKNTNTTTLIFERLICAFLGRGDPFPIHCDGCILASVKFLPTLLQNFTHTRCSSSSFIVTLSLIWWTACACAQFSRCSSTTIAHSKMGQMAVCCQNLMLGVLNSCSTLSLLVDALFKRFDLFLNTPST